MGQSSGSRGIQRSVLRALAVEQVEPHDDGGRHYGKFDTTAIDLEVVAVPAGLLESVTLNSKTETRWGWIIDLDKTGDLDGNGVVNLFDLLELLANW